MNLDTYSSHTTIMSKSGRNGVTQRPSRIGEGPILVPTQVLHHINRQNLVLKASLKDPLGSERVQFQSLIIIISYQNTKFTQLQPNYNLKPHNINVKCGPNGLIQRPSRIREGPLPVPKQVFHHVYILTLQNLNLTTHSSITPLKLKSGPKASPVDPLGSERVLF